MTLKNSRVLSFTLLFAVGLLARPATGEPGKDASREGTITIVVTKDRLLVSTNGKLPSDFKPKVLDGEGMVVRCDSCEIDRQDGQKKVVTFRCGGNVLLEGNGFSLRANSVMRDGTSLTATGDAELWMKGADKKKTSYTLGGRIRFDMSTKTVEVDDGRSLSLDSSPPPASTSP